MSGKEKPPTPTKPDAFRSQPCTPQNQIKRPCLDMSPATPEITLNSISAILRTELKPLSDNIVTLQNQVIELQTQVNSITDLNKRTDEIETHNAFLETELSHCKEEINELKEKNLSLETNSRRDNLRFINVSFDNNKTNCENAVCDLLQNVGIALLGADIVRAHLTGSPNQKTRTILVRFHHNKIRQMVFSKRKALKQKTGVIISEDFPLEIVQRRKVLFPILNEALQKMEKYKPRLIYDILYLAGKKYTASNLDSLPEELKPVNICTKENDGTIAFFNAGSPMSNFNPAKFQLNNVNYTSSEQCYFHQMCLHFGQNIKANEIMSTTNPAKAKALGEQVKSQNKDKWMEVCDNYMQLAVKAKFTQSSHHKSYLIATGLDNIVEASKDTYWGIGVALKDKKLWSKKEWLGQNRLGEILQTVRAELF